MITSYHNHTTWSDGMPTVEEQIEAARTAGLDELGISDHYALLPDGGRVSWAMPPERLGDYVEDILSAAARTDRPVVRLGIEIDYFPETVAQVREALARYPFDYVVGSVHFLDGFPIDSKRQPWDALTADERTDKWRLYWRRMAEMAESRVADFAAHLDLPKKFGHRPNVDLSREAHAALDAIAAADMALEINTAGWNLPAKEAYPSLGLLVEARKRGIPLLINSDAHQVQRLTADFDRARDLARQAGYTELVRYEKRRRYAVPLGEGDR